jgi:hypothetical protein
MNALFNLALGGYAVFYASSHWNVSADQFSVGLNFTLAMWCACDLLKMAAGRS